MSLSIVMLFLFVSISSCSYSSRSRLVPISLGPLFRLAFVQYALPLLAFGLLLFVLVILDFITFCIYYLFFLVVRVLGYRSGGPGSIPGTTRKKK
jgi:hypothetical protein